MVRGPGGLYNDMSLSKSFVLSERWGTFQLMAQAFNVFNHTVLQNPDTNIADKGGSFGTITSAAAPRTVQLVLRYSF
jgi:hypothetical protein